MFYLDIEYSILNFKQVVGKLDQSGYVSTGAFDSLDYCEIRIRIRWVHNVIFSIMLP